MGAGNVIRLVVLGALWGASFLFMRVLSPVLGPLATADSRVLLAGLALLVVLRLQGRSLELEGRWKIYAVVGVLQAGLPFLLYCLAALHLPASYSAVLNATAPCFAMLTAGLFGEQRASASQLFGGGLGMAGVAVLTGFGPVVPTPLVLASVAACLGAALCYALAGHYIRLRATEVPPLVLTAGSHLAVGLFLFPAAYLNPPPAELTAWVATLTLAQALLCSALAFVLYFRLVNDLGPTRALTVTYLIPLFGLLWGWALLGEQLTWGMAAGGVLVLAGTVLVLSGRPPAGGSE